MFNVTKFANGNGLYSITGQLSNKQNGKEVWINAETLIELSKYYAEPTLKDELCYLASY